MDEYYYKTGIHPCSIGESVKNYNDNFKREFPNVRIPSDIPSTSPLYKERAIDKIFCIVNKQTPTLRPVQSDTADIVFVIVLRYITWYIIERILGFSNWTMLLIIGKIRLNECLLKIIP